jgi:DNA-binding MarR family transcriptional regulator
MEIEEVIKIKKFRNEFEKLVINLSYTASWIRSQQIQFFRKYDLSPEQYNVLRILRGQYPKQSSVNLVQQRMIEKMSNASRLIDKLVKKDLVERKECPDDRRQADVKITQHGLGLLEKIDSGIEHLNKQMFQCDENEARKINDILNKIRT